MGRFLLLAISVITIMTGCRQSKDVMSDNWIQHRKYRSGFYIEKSHPNNSTVKQELPLLTIVKTTSSSIETDPSVGDSSVVVVPLLADAIVIEQPLKQKIGQNNFSKKVKSFILPKHQPRIIQPSYPVAAIAVAGGELSEHNYLRTAIICALLALILQIVGTIAIDGGAFALVAYILWIAALVFLILWLIDSL